MFATFVDIPVIIFSDLPPFWMRTNRRVRLVHTDADGHFEVRGLPEGRYLAVAAKGTTERDLGRTGRLQQMRRNATPFTFDPDMRGVALELRRTGDRPPTPAAR